MEIQDEGWVVAVADENSTCYHVIPYDDIDEHEPYVTCWCQPAMESRDADTGSEVWEHRRAKDNPV